LQGSEAPGEDDAEDEDGDDDAVGEILVGFRGGGKGGEQDVGHEAKTKACEHYYSSAKFVEEGGAVDGAEHGEDWVDGVD